MGISFSDYLEMQRRLDRSAVQPAGDACEDEAKLHQDILDWCAKCSPRWIVFRGSMAHKTYRTPGEPDMIVAADGGRTFYIECKTRTGKLSPAQQAIRAWADLLGHKVHVIRSLKEFIEIVTV